MLATGALLHQQHGIFPLAYCFPRWCLLSPRAACVKANAGLLTRQPASRIMKGLPVLFKSS